MPLLSVPANDIDIAGLSLESDLPPDWLAAELSDADLTAEKPGRAVARLSRTGNAIVVRGKVKAELSMPCARCLKPTPLSVDTEMTLLLQPASTGQGAAHKVKSGNGKATTKKADDDEYEFTSEEADIDFYDGEVVVLDPFVREAILLEVPNFPLCSEDCPGIQPAPEASPVDSGPALDPRLAPLSALREKLAQRDSPRRPSRPPGAKKTKPNKE